MPTSIVCSLANLLCPSETSLAWMPSLSINIPWEWTRTKNEMLKYHLMNCPVDMGDFIILLMSSPLCISRCDSWSYTYPLSEESPKRQYCSWEGKLGGDFVCFIWRTSNLFSGTTRSLGHSCLDSSDRCSAWSSWGTQLLRSAPIHEQVPREGCQTPSSTLSVSVEGTNRNQTGTKQEPIIAQPKRPCLERLASILTQLLFGKHP